MTESSGGDNTDWSGVKACIDSAGMSGLADAQAIAARAACYALVELGIPRILVVNQCIVSSTVPIRKTC